MKPQVPPRGDGELHVDWPTVIAALCAAIIALLLALRAAYDMVAVVAMNGDLANENDLLRKLITFDEKRQAEKSRPDDAPGRPSLGSDEG